MIYSDAREIDYLAEYARCYSTVEIDQWFWSLFGPESIKLPEAGDVAAYRRAVPDGFRFTVKAPNSITLTHLYSGGSEPLVPNARFLSVELQAQFLERVAPLGDLLGPIMFQFEYLNRRKMESQAGFLAQFERFVESIDRSYRYALEVRNPTYLNQVYWDMLLRQDVIPVLIQGYWMPPIREIYDAWRAPISAHHTVILRLMGPDRQAIEAETGKRWDRIVAPRGEELNEIVDVVTDLAGQGVDVYVNVNNHYEGSAPLTIERLAQRLARRLATFSLPPPLGNPPTPQRLPGL
ncbi:MAG: DUF72 domain-containing protein [Anaerolineae bacterium]|nr:DUF72 domain-containing protein [Anaerolineae bacterium]